MAKNGFKRFYNNAETWNDETVFYHPVTPTQAYDIGQVNSVELENKRKTELKDNTEPRYKSFWRQFKDYADDMKYDQSSSGVGEAWKKNKCCNILITVSCVLIACILCVGAVLLFHYVVLPNVNPDPSLTLAFSTGGLTFIIICAVLGLIIYLAVWKKCNCRGVLIIGTCILIVCILCACAILAFHYGVLPTRRATLGETMAFASGGVTFLVLFLVVGLIAADTHTDAQN
jgi:hypothetical protein